MGLCPAVLWLVVGWVAGLAGRVAACIATPPASRSCERAVSYGAERRIVAPGYIVSRQKVTPLSHDTIVVSRPSSQLRESCCAHAWSHRKPPGSIVAEQWPCRGLLHRVVVSPCALPSLACHDTNHCIVTQSWRMGSSPASQHKLFFFHIKIFFLSFQLLENHQYIYIYIYIYSFFFHFPVEPNKFSKIYFIYFFQFYTL